MNAIQKQKTVRQDGAAVFSFGDPVSMLDSREILDYIECWSNGRWYEMPVSPDGLARSLRVNVHHSSAIYAKRNILASTFIPHPKFPLDTFNRVALDFLIFGNAYLEKKTNWLGELLSLRHSLAKYTRRGVDEGIYYFIYGWKQEHEFARGSIFQLMESDINQEVYGLPEYLSALQSAWLNESATLFRRKYYQNGSHAGFIMYMTDASHSQQDIDDLRKALRESKGPGNFRNIFIYAPNGKKDGIQLIPVSEVAARDEFFNIKGVTRDDVLAAHRVPPQLLGIIPNNTGGFGDIEKAARVFARNELKPLQDKFRQINDWAGEKVVDFTEYKVTNELP